MLTWEYGTTDWGWLMVWELRVERGGSNIQHPTSNIEHPSRPHQTALASRASISLGVMISTPKGLPNTSRSWSREMTKTTLISCGPFSPQRRSAAIPLLRGPRRALPQLPFPELPRPQRFLPRADAV